MKRAGAAWPAAELRDELLRFERELRSAGLKDASVQTYVGRTEVFIRWPGLRTAGVTLLPRSLQSKIMQRTEMRLKGPEPR